MSDAKNANETAIGGLGAVESAAPVDLAKVGISSGNQGQPPTPPITNTLQSVSKPFDLGEVQQKIALRIIWVLIAIVACIFLISVILGGWCFYDKAQCVAAGNALDLVVGKTKDIFTAMLGLVGSIVGFYFGQRSER